MKSIEMQMMILLKKFKWIFKKEFSFHIFSDRFSSTYRKIKQPTYLMGIFLADFSILLLHMYIVSKTGDNDKLFVHFKILGFNI